MGTSGCKHEMSKDLALVWSPGSHPGSFFVAYPWGYRGLAVGLGRLLSPRRTGAGSPLLCPRTVLLHSVLCHSHLGNSRGWMSLTSQACQRNPTAPHIPRYHHSSTATLPPAVCTLVAQAVAIPCKSGAGDTDFTCKWWLGWRQLPPVRYKRCCFACHKGGRVRVCVHVNKSGQQQSTPRLLPLPCPTGGTQCPGSEGWPPPSTPPPCGQLSSIPPPCRPSHR